jgi:hypothetical protein
MGQLNEGEVLLEYHRVGAYVKVSAIDPVTQTEVSIVGDPKRSEAELARVALNKLKYVMSKQAATRTPR